MSPFTAGMCFRKNVIKPARGAVKPGKVELDSTFPAPDRDIVPRVIPDARIECFR